MAERQSSVNRIDQLADIFVHVAGKHLTAVDAEPDRSNQHELGGLVSAGFGECLGRPADGRKERFSATFVYISDDQSEPIVVGDVVTWYDSRHGKAGRSAEYRLYYPTNPVTAEIAEGDFMLVAFTREGELLIVFTQAESETEFQLRSIFAVPDTGTSLTEGRVGTTAISLPIRMLLEELGLPVGEPSAKADHYLEQMIHNFGGTFPATRIFSDFAADLCEVDAVEDPDGALMVWMDFEEQLFRVYERHLVGSRLQQGFGSEGDDVDEFVAYSLSVQNRRKSRVGRAFENHLRRIFALNRVSFEEGSSACVTENRSKPDFLFPGFTQYHDPDFPTPHLRILGAKTTCKDRWRQVLAEADRIDRKHLVTLQPAISEYQTDEMQAKGLNLVIPAELHFTFTGRQRQWLQNLDDFIREVAKTQTA